MSLCSTTAVDPAGSSLVRLLPTSPKPETWLRDTDPWGGGMVWMRVGRDLELFYEDKPGHWARHCYYNQAGQNTWWWLHGVDGRWFLESTGDAQVRAVESTLLPENWSRCLDPDTGRLCWRRQGSEEWFCEVQSGSWNRFVFPDGSGWWWLHSKSNNTDDERWFLESASDKDTINKYFDMLRSGGRQVEYNFSMADGWLELGAADYTELQRALVADASPSSLHLSGHIPASILVALAEVLKDDCKLSSLTVGYDDDDTCLVSEASVALAKALEQNTSLDSLSFCNCQGICDKTILALGEALKLNANLQCLSLDILTDIRVETSVLFARALQCSKCLSKLELDVLDTSLGNQTVYAFAEFFGRNTCLRSFVLHADFDDAAGFALADALRRNTNLRDLELGGCIGDVAGAALVDAVRHNANIRSFRYQAEEFGNTACLSVASLLRSNNRLHSLGLGLSIGGAAFETCSVLARALEKNFRILAFEADDWQYGEEPCDELTLAATNVLSRNEAILQQWRVLSSLGRCTVDIGHYNLVEASFRTVLLSYSVPSQCTLAPRWRFEGGPAEALSHAAMLARTTIPPSPRGAVRTPSRRRS